MSMQFDINDINRRMDGAIAAFKHDLAGLRTGRASVNLLDTIVVDAYGAPTPLNQVANVTVPEARMLSVSVWDKALVGRVERAIRDSGLGLNPITDGMLLRIPLPELNEQRRKELVKIAHQYAESSRVAIRHVRRDGLDSLKKFEKDGHLGQDEGRALADKVQKMTDEFIADVERLLLQKEGEIMQI
jgi:ribosome recycling factor